MSFDAWVVAFGIVDGAPRRSTLSKAPRPISFLAAVHLIDAWLLRRFFAGLAGSRRR